MNTNKIIIGLLSMLLVGALGYILLSDKNATTNQAGNSTQSSPDFFTESEVEEKIRQHLASEACQDSSGKSGYCSLGDKRNIYKHSLKSYRNINVYETNISELATHVEYEAILNKEDGEEVVVDNSTLIFKLRNGEWVSPNLKN